MSGRKKKQPTIQDLKISRIFFLLVKGKSPLLTLLKWQFVLLQSKITSIIMVKSVKNVKKDLTSLRSKK